MSQASDTAPQADGSMPRPEGGAPRADGHTPRFPALPAQIDLPAIEREMLVRWQDADVFTRSLKQTEGGLPWTFYEGPPTANGMPGVHHVEARVFKDVFPRFKTMQGFHVPRQAGWDCHGLPVEVAVERELGISGKKDIEAYGITEFNERCRESVLRHVDAFTELTERMGYWIDLSKAYRTMDPSYIESVWWSLKDIFDKGLLVRDFRISPYCPRCGTPLSDHEMGQPGVYQTVTDPSVTVRFPLTRVSGGASPELVGADLLVWTTTPWTLVSNTAVAVHPDVTYVVARQSDDSDARGGGRGADAERARRGLGRRGALPRRRAARCHLRPAVPPDRHSRCAHRGTRDVRDDRRRHRPGARGAGVRRGRHAGVAAPTGCRWSTRSGPTAGSRTACPWWAACSSRTPTRG